MYEERQKQWVYNQTHRNDKCPPGNQKQITATSSNKNTTGGMSSSSSGKLTGDSGERDLGGQWVARKGMTYRGQGEPMQIDAKKQKQHNEGRCFRCNKKGHLSRDFPHKKQEVCAVETAEVPLSMDTKIEEVKEQVIEHPIPLQQPRTYILVNSLLLSAGLTLLYHAQTL